MNSFPQNTHDLRGWVSFGFTVQHSKVRTRTVKSAPTRGDDENADFGMLSAWASNFPALYFRYWNHLTLDLRVNRKKNRPTP